MPGTPPDLTPTWYVALVRGGMERIAEAHLLNVGFTETFCPRHIVRSVVRGHTTEHLVAVASGYVLCAAQDFTPELWHRACPESGEVFVPVPKDDTYSGHRRVPSGYRLVHGLVHGFVGGWRDETPPDPVPQAAIDAQRALCDADGVWLDAVPPPLIIYEPGAAVRVSNLDHPAYGHVFTVVWDNGKGLNLRSLHWHVDRVYITREHVEPLVKDSRVGPTKKYEDEGTHRRRKRGFRRCREASEVA